MNIDDVEWCVEYTEEFGTWWDSLTVSEQKSIDRVVIMLQERGPHPAMPYTKPIVTSKYAHMRELRIQHEGRPYRVFYAFDPRRCAILLIGGHKVGDEKRFYEVYVHRADQIYAEHLTQLREEGLNAKD